MRRTRVHAGHTLATACLAVMTGCCCGTGGGESAPVAEDLMEAYVDDPVTPSPEPATPGGDGTVAAPDTPPPTDLLPAEHREKLDGLTAMLATVHTAEQFAAAYRELKTTAPTLWDPLNALYEASEAGTGPSLPMDMFRDHPFYALDWGPEGLSVMVAMPFAPLRERAAATPEPSDDALLDLLELMYDDAMATGWSKLDNRNWDYGGCSPLGSGAHHRILKATDVARSHGDLFAPEIQAVREEVLQAILEDDELFPYCMDTEADLTPVEKLRTEVDSILADVDLSDEERVQLTARRDSRFTVRRGKLDR